MTMNNERDRDGYSFRFCDNADCMAEMRCGYCRTCLRHCRPTSHPKIRKREEKAKMTIIREAMQTIERIMDHEAALEFNRTRRVRGLHLLRRAKLRLAILERQSRKAAERNEP